ncbi:hypothetical protein C1H46_018339 [Malus baccata]|uniref:At1g61320/AtMIF1 LRR domain-containing protein n=1 Tax=Malus baccata TaxID=106549 RepID=A0A540MB73_MALBA|nr:hypothetical protein C1H46_018339 [Malus baccata]
MTKRKRGVVMADRISELPDEVLNQQLRVSSLRNGGGVPSLQPCIDVGSNFLRAVKLKNVRLAGGGLEYFLCNCPALERLAIYDIPDLRILRVVGLSIPLKYLVIKDCDNIESIVIRDANLVSFTYSGHKMNLIIRNVPLLAEVSIVQGYTKCDFLDVAFTQLESCSQLHILKLLKKIFKRAECSHRCLKVVEMLRYYGRRGDARLVKYLTTAAVNLEEIGVSPIESFYNLDTDEKREELESDRARKDRATKELKQIVPSTVKVAGTLMLLD